MNKKILYINSYHCGDKWSDGIVNGIETVLGNNPNVHLKTIELDSKRKPSEQDKQQAALRAKIIIEAFCPDVIIISDDNAVKYLLMTYYQNSPLPFVVCGLSHSNLHANFPHQHVSSMLKISQLPQLIRYLKVFTQGQNIGVLGAVSDANQNLIKHHQTNLGIDYHKVSLVDNFEDWLEAYANLQRTVDMMILIGHKEVANWDEAAAHKFVFDVTRIPVGSIHDEGVPYSLLALGRIPEEQGIWAAQAALKILSGGDPEKITLNHNRKFHLFFNAALADKLGITKHPQCAIPF